MASPSTKIYRCGTLTYTLPQLVMTGGWLLLGGFAYALATSVPGAILPLKLQELGVSDQTKMILLSTIGGVLNMTVCPYIGVASDRCRSRWGRRIPYIFKSMPPIVLALVLFALSGRFGAALAAWAAPWWTVAPATMTVAVIGMVMVLYQFFVMWVGSVIWYIFNDIIPPEMHGRIMAVFNIGMSASSALFHYFVFPHARRHAAAIFLGVALMYGVVISLMCLFVREGTYPPLKEPAQTEGKPSAWQRLATVWRNLREFLRESFCHRLYVMKYLLTICTAMCGCAGIYFFFYYCELGLDDRLIGRLNGINSLVATIGLMVTSLLASRLVNRWHPVRIYFYNLILGSLASMPMVFQFLFGTLPPGVFVVMVVSMTACSLFINGLNSICFLPMEMMIFPKSRFGSFCSIQALLRSTATTVAGVGIGAFFDFLGRCFPAHPEFRYRFVEAVSFPFSILVILLAYLVFREWLRQGGYATYACPAPWEKDGREHLDLLPLQPVSPQKLRRSLRFFDIALTASTALFLVYPMAVGKMRDGAARLELWPVAILLLTDLLWMMIRRCLIRKMLLAEEGRETIPRLPHPGMIITVWLTQLCVLFVLLWSNYFADGYFARVTLILCALKLLGLTIGVGIISRLESAAPQEGS